jgi:uncharacterized membrane protein YgaE (UPF0421/DUF939 family)
VHLGGVAELVRARFRDLVEWESAPGLRTGKTVLACVLSFVIATWLDTSPSPVLAPLTALLVVQLSLYETLAHGWERMLSVVSGVLLAVLFASVTGLTWWSLGLIIGVSLVAGRLLRLGPHLLEVPISAMLVLAVGGAESAALERIVETLIGAAVGVLVNLLIAPPLYIRPAGEAIAELCERMARSCLDSAEALRGEWSREVAAARLEWARALSEQVARADARLARTEESARLNPRGRPVREARPRLRGTLTALEHAQVALRQLTRVLLDRTFFVPETEAAGAWSPTVRDALADLLGAAAVVLRDTAQLTVTPAVREAARGTVDGHLTDLAEHRDRLAAALLADARVDAAGWSQHGGLLDAVDRLRVELAAALHPAEPAWTPPPLAEQQRRAVREAMHRRLRRRPGA